MKPGGHTHTAGDNMFHLWVGHILVFKFQHLICIPTFMAWKWECVCDKKWLNADLIFCLSEQQTETEREHQVCEDYFHHLPSQGPLMEEPTRGRVCVFVRVCVGNEFIHWSGQSFSLLSFGEYNTDLVIYTTAVSPRELWVSNKTRNNIIISQAPYSVSLKWNLCFGPMAIVPADLMEAEDSYCCHSLCVLCCSLTIYADGLQPVLWIIFSHAGKANRCTRPADS